MTFRFDTDPALAAVLAELQSREPIFHRPELGTTRANFEAMTAEDFWEVGASSRIYSREQLLDVVEQRHTDPTWRDGSFQTSDFHCRGLAQDVFLLTYLLRQGQRARLVQRSVVFMWVAILDGRMRRTISPIERS